MYIHVLYIFILVLYLVQLKVIDVSCILDNDVNTSQMLLIILDYVLIDKAINYDMFRQILCQKLYTCIYIAWVAHITNSIYF